MTHMTSRIGIRALQQNASAVVAEAAAGDVVEITDRGRPVARLVPLGGSALEQLVRSDLARPPRLRVADLGPPLELPSRPSLGDVLARARADER